MSAAMASKRFGRTFQEEESNHTEKQQQQHQQHRQSRSARQEDGPRERRRTSTSSSSATESRESSMAAESVVEVALGGEQVIVASVETKATDSVPVVGRDSRHARPVITIGDSPFAVSLPPVYASPTMKPPLPTEGRPHNFGVVVPGVYRCSYPKLDDFTFMKDLGLKTIVTLGRKDEPDETYADFMTANSIRHHVIDMKGTKKESIPIHTMKTILRIVLDQQHHPLLIHCNHGKHRTGCVVAVVRKLSGWRLETIIDEYRTYAEPKVRECDVDYITAFELSELSNLFVQEANMRFRTRAFYRATIFAFAVLVLWAVSSRQITYTARSAGNLR